MELTIQAQDVAKKYRTHLAALRKKHDVSRMRLVREAGFSYPTVVRWETEAMASIEAEKVAALMDIFGVTHDQLIYIVDED